MRNLRIWWSWLTIQDFRDETHIQEALGHLNTLEDEAIDRLMQRFPTRDVSLAVSLFDIDWQYSDEGEADARW